MTQEKNVKAFRSFSLTQISAVNDSIKFFKKFHECSTQVHGDSFVPTLVMGAFSQGASQDSLGVSPGNQNILKCPGMWEHSYENPVHGVNYLLATV